MMSIQSPPICTSPLGVKATTSGRLAAGSCTGRVPRITACYLRQHRGGVLPAAAPAQILSKRDEALTAGLHRVSVLITGRFGVRI